MRIIPTIGLDAGGPAFERKSLYADTGLRSGLPVIATDRAALADETGGRNA